MRQFENSFRIATPIWRVLLLCTVIIAQNFLSQDLFSPLVVLAGFSILIVSYGKIKRSYLKLVWPLFGVFVIGIIGAFNHESHDILRDIAFALVPLALIYIGYWLGSDKRMWPLILRVMAFCGLVLAVNHLSTFVTNPELLGENAFDVRQVAGGGGGALVTFSLVLGLFQKRLGIGHLFPMIFPRFIFIAVLLASFVLSYSRTDIVIAIIFLLSLWGVLSRVNLRLILVIVVLSAGFVTIIATVPEGETGTLRSKLARSVTEVAVSNYEDLTDINTNWRGFETYRALLSFSSSSVAQQILGQGFGALVDIGFDMEFVRVGVQLRYIPILHNGYAYILIKAGMLGVLLYAIFYFKIIRQGMRYSQSPYFEERLLARLLLGCIWSLIIVMFVIGGMAQTAEPALVLLLGYLVRRMELLQVMRQRDSGYQKVSATQ